MRSDSTDGYSSELVLKTIRPQDNFFTVTGDPRIRVVWDNVGNPATRHLEYDGTMGQFLCYQYTDWDDVVDTNLVGSFLVLREAARLFRDQGTGGNVVVNSSKNVFGPGADFGAYSASKAAGHQLGKVAAIELAPIGVRVNMINADAVFAEGDTPSGLWREIGPDRARSRGVAPEKLQEYYRERNLLHAEVTGADVGRAVVFFASNQTPTTGATLPVDGGIVAAFPR